MDYETRVRYALYWKLSEVYRIFYEKGLLGEKGDKDLFNLGVDLAYMLGYASPAVGYPGWSAPKVRY